MEHSDIKVGKDGRIIGYRSVNKDFKDHHSKTFDNHPGNMLFMDRNKVSDDPAQACHYGFHIGSLKYAQSNYNNSSNHMLVVAVDPEDVVCIPNDSSFQKMRCCRYHVLKVYDGKELPDGVWEDEILDEVPTKLIKNVGVPNLEVPSASTHIAEESEYEPPPAVFVPTDPSPKTLVASATLLGEMSLATLRAEALKRGIKGASKLPGGKEALIKVMIARMEDEEKAKSTKAAADAKVEARPTELTPAQLDEVREMVRTGGQKIPIIKRVRELAAMSLKEAKDVVEQLFDQCGPKQAQAAPTEPVAPPATAPAPAAEPVEEPMKLQEAALRNMNIGDLRKRAGKEGIVGASKLPGGKEALIKAILAKTAKIAPKPPPAAKVVAAKKPPAPAKPAPKKASASKQANPAIEALKAQSLKELRTLAASLGITGASKLPGGKEALLKKVIAHYKKKA